MAKAEAGPDEGDETFDQERIFFKFEASFQAKTRSLPRAKKYLLEVKFFKTVKKPARAKKNKLLKMHQYPVTAMPSFRVEEIDIGCSWKTPKAKTHKNVFTQSNLDTVTS